VNITRKVLAAIPEERRDYRPHADSRSALELAWHLVSSEIWFLDGIIQGQFGPEEMRMPPHIRSIADILAWHSRNVPQLLDGVEKMPGQDLVRPIPFFGLFNHPAVVYLNLLLVHSVHHRGQITAYLRPMGAKVPSIYGGSADEPFEVAAQG
jgi:uncharacterized damage-inducible protein DinB